METKTINFALRTSETNEFNEHPIYISIEYPDGYLIVRTEVYVSQNDWDVEKEEVLSSDKSYDLKNELLESSKAFLEEYEFPNDLKV